MSQFSTSIGVSVKQFAVNYDCATDTGSYSQKDHMSGSVSGSVHRFAESHQISVISQLGRKSGLFFHPVCQFQIFPALNILRTSQYDTIRTIDNSRCPYPDTGYRIFLCFSKVFTSMIAVTNCPMTASADTSAFDGNFP